MLPFKGSFLNEACTGRVSGCTCAPPTYSKSSAAASLSLSCWPCSALALARVPELAERKGEFRRERGASARSCAQGAPGHCSFAPACAGSTKAVESSSLRGRENKD